MRVTGLALAVAAALVGQTALGRYFAGGLLIDLVLIVVVFAALSFGPVTGLVTGTIAGLVQDAMATGIVGIGGLAKTAVGFVTGLLGTQFIVAHTLPRFVVFFGASVVHTLMFIGIHALVGRDITTAASRVALQGLGSAVVGVLAFKAAEALPGAVERRRQAGPRLRR